MPSNFPRDRFDDVARDKGRVGAHRAELPRSRGWATFLWASVAAVVLFVGGVFGALVVMGKITFGDSASPESSITQAPIEARIDTNYSVLILNATPDAEKTAEVTQILLANGWTEDKIFSIDSDDKDFEHTTVYYPLPGDQSPALGLAGLMGDALIDESDAYQVGHTNESAQLTIVIGADFAPAG